MLMPKSRRRPGAVAANRRHVEAIKNHIMSEAQTIRLHGAVKRTVATIQDAVANRSQAVTLPMTDALALTNFALYALVESAHFGRFRVMSPHQEDVRRPGVCYWCDEKWPHPAAPISETGAHR